MGHRDPARGNLTWPGVRKPLEAVITLRTRVMLRAKLESEEKAFIPGRGESIY